MENKITFQPTKTPGTQKTVLVGGCFDLIHYGHIKFLEEAKKHGDILIVMLESDETIQKKKGVTRPFHSQDQRKEMIEALRCVDKVIVMQPLTTDQEYFDLVKQIHPTFIAFTEGDPIMEKKLKQTELVGAQAIIIPKIVSPSTTALSKLIGLE